MLGLGQWLIDLDSLDLAIAGFFWLLTPPRDITFVHAVQQPLADPLLTPTNPGAARSRYHLHLLRRNRDHSHQEYGKTGSHSLLG
jgi:hypothetical protein